MKIQEIKDSLKKYSNEELQIIIELYKVLPKKIKEENNIDSIIEDVGKYTKKDKKPDTNITDFEELTNETNAFFDYAYNQYYLIPNRIVPKNEMYSGPDTNAMNKPSTIST